MLNPKPITISPLNPSDEQGYDPQPLGLSGGIPGIPSGGVAGQILTRASSEPFDNKWVTPAGTPLVYGSFYDTANQPLTPANTVIPVKIRLAATQEGVSLVGETGIRVEQDGVYNFQFSLQVASTTNQTRNLHLWGRTNGVNLDHSAGRISVTEQNSVIVPTWNYVLPLSAGDVFILCASVDGAGVTLAAEPATAVHPATASSIITVHQIGR